MTSLLFTLTILGLLTLCVLIGKYNKSDNLALILTMALLSGMAGGAIVNKLNAKDKKENSLKQIKSPTQTSTANSVDLYALLSDPVVLHENDNTKSVTKDIKVYASDIEIVAPSKRGGEIRAQPFGYKSIRGGPNNFFDTS